MSQFSGMDIAQIRNLATQMTSDAAEIQSKVQALASEVEGVAWQGTDRDRFLDEWHSRHAVALKRVADGLVEAARHANEHARQQEWASRA